MADMNGWPTDGADGSVSSEARWRAMARLFAPSGVVDGYLGELAPSLAAGSITVQAGAAWIDGHYAEILTSTTFGATVTGLVVARFTPADNAFELIYRDGATTPTQTEATWELPIARITSSALTDVRPMLFPGGATTRRIGHTVLTAPATEIDWPNLPTDMVHLRIVAMLRGDTASPQTNLYVRCNGDAGANYYNQRTRSTGSTVTGLENLAQNGVLLTSPSGQAFGSAFAPVTVDIPGYRISGSRRNILTQLGSAKPTSGGFASGDLSVDTGFAVWQSTSIINRVTIATTSGNLAAGSTATLYGLM